MKLVSTRDADALLLEQMLAPLPLEQARSSLEFWRGRRKALPFYRRHERREADEMIHRWRARVVAAERARFGTGLFDQIRRRLAREPLLWPLGRKWELFAFAWSILPRRIAVIAAAAFGAFLAGMVGIGLGLIVLVLYLA